MEGMTVTVPESFPGWLVMSISKTFLNDGFQFLHRCGDDGAVADGTGQDQPDGAGAALFVGEGIAENFFAAAFGLNRQAE